MRSTKNCGPKIRQTKIRETKIRRPKNRRPLSPGTLIALIFTAVFAVENAQAQSVPTKATPKALKEATPVAARTTGPALTLENFLHLVEQKNGNFRSLKASREAATARRIAGDAELASVFTAKYVDSESKRPQLIGTFGTITGTTSNEASLGLAKKFSTGTNVAVTGGVVEQGQSISSAAGNGETKNAYGALGLSISQSLWKNFFGKATDLRRERESLVEKAEVGQLDVQQRTILIQAESAFWDHVYLREELRQRVESLERAKGLGNWMSKRVGNGIGDRSDLIGTEALTAGRELQLLSTQDELTASTRKIRDLLEMGADELPPELVGQLDGARDLNSQVNGEFGGSKANAQILGLDVYLASLQARAKAVVADETYEAYKPDLVLSGSYSTNSVDTSMNAAAQDISNTRIPSTSVGIAFTYMIDQDIKGAARDVAKMEALSAKQIQERKLLEGKTAWEEILRRHKEMSERVKIAERSSRLQVEKADAEKDKLSKGRSITSTVVQAEEDAANGRLTLAKLQAEQRKLEAQGRMFVRLSEEK